MAGKSRYYNIGVFVSRSIKYSIMISFTSFPGHEQTGHHPSVNEDLMDLDDLEDFEAKGSKLTWPGEYLTSSQAYMR
jgi:exosome complex component RRP4